MAEFFQTDAVAQTEVAAFRYTRLVDGEKRRFDQLADAMGGEDVASQTWLFVSPHDDDLCVGAGLLIQAAAEAGVNVHALIVTDGRMGYCTKEQKETIMHLMLDLEGLGTRPGYVLCQVGLVRFDHTGAH